MLVGLFVEVFDFFFGNVFFGNFFFYLVGFVFGGVVVLCLCVEDVDFISFFFLELNFDCV